MILRRALVGTLPFWTLCFGCGSKGSVAVTGSIDTPMVVVGPGSALATAVTGAFNLHVELGSLAPSSTDVSIASVSLVRPGDQSTLLLLKTTAAPPAPFHLDPGGHADVKVTIGDDSGAGQVVSNDMASSICQAKTVQIAGSITDTASAASSPVASLSFEVTGCP